MHEPQTTSLSAMRSGVFLPIGSEIIKLTLRTELSKAALNAWTAQLSIVLKDTNMKVNACHPGWIKTDIGGAQAPMDTQEGAETAMYLATLPQDGPTGGFFHKQEVLPW